MSNTAYTPGQQNQPYGLLNANPQSSVYSTVSGFSPQEEILIAKAIQRKIFDSAPAQYDALKIIFEKEFAEVPSDEFQYNEQTYHRSAMEVLVGTAAVPAVPSTQVTANITVTAGTAQFAAPDLIIALPTNEKVVIKAVAGAVLTIGSLTSSGIPLISAGDPLSIVSSIDADGMDYFSIYERTNIITRYNFLHLFCRAKRWDRIELQKYKNNATTDYLDVDKGNLVKAIRTDMFNMLFNGEGGEFSISNNNVAKTMWGIFPSMQTSQSANGSTTTAGLQPMFESLAFNTNFKAVGATRFVYGCSEMLYELSKVFKQPGIRYTPNDRIANLNLNRYEIGTMGFVPVACELFREPANFPAAWGRRLLVLDQETIQPIKMQGIPQFEMGGTLDAEGMDGSRERFKDWYVRGNLSMRMNNPLSSFWIDIL